MILFATGHHRWERIRGHTWKWRCKSKSNQLITLCNDCAFQMMHLCKIQTCHNMLQAVSPPPLASHCKTWLVRNLVCLLSTGSPRSCWPTGIRWTKWREGMTCDTYWRHWGFKAVSLDINNMLCEMFAGRAWTKRAIRTPRLQRRTCQLIHTYVLTEVLLKHFCVQNVTWYNLF